MSSKKSLLRLLLIFLLPVLAHGATNWPCWRGPELNNHAPGEQNPPVKWDEKQNVLWRVPLPGQGHAGPCIYGGRIYLPVADAASQTIWLLGLDRETGKILWRAEVYHGPFPKIHTDNSHASATPACDGEKVYFPYQTADSVYMAAFDLDGKPVWNKAIGPYKAPQGYAASPAIYKSSVITALDAGSFRGLFALDCKTGAQLWRAPLAPVPDNYATPLVAHVAGRDQAIIMGGNKTSSYDPASGKPLWTCDGPAQFCAATVTCGPDTVYANGGNPQKTMQAIRADGHGDVTKTHLAWKVEQKAGFVPSPLLEEGLLYGVNEQGLLRCYDAANGKIVWEENLKAPFYSSPVLAGGRIYLFDKKGKGYVFKAGRKFELLGGGQLPQGVFAAPVILDGRIYLRTLKDFYCLAAAKP